MKCRALGLICQAMARFSIRWSAGDARAQQIPLIRPVAALQGRDGAVRSGRRIDKKYPYDRYLRRHINVSFIT